MPTERCMASFGRGIAKKFGKSRKFGPSCFYTVCKRLFSVYILLKMYYIQTSFKNNKKKSLTKISYSAQKKTYPYRFHIKKSDCAAGAFSLIAFAEKCARSVFLTQFSVFTFICFAGGNPSHVLLASRVLFVFLFGPVADAAQFLCGFLFAGFVFGGSLPAKRRR